MNKQTRRTHALTEIAFEAAARTSRVPTKKTFLNEPSPVKSRLNITRKS